MGPLVGELLVNTWTHKLPKAKWVNIKQLLLFFLFGQYDDLATREVQNTASEEGDEYSISRVVISPN